MFLKVGKTLFESFVWIVLQMIGCTVLNIVGRNVCDSVGWTVFEGFGWEVLDSFNILVELCVIKLAGCF